MPMPSSGSIGIKICPGSVACTSISQAVDGNVTGDKSLSTLSTTAGKSAPHCMREFYGYSSSVSIKFGSEVSLCESQYHRDKYVPLIFTNRASPNIMTICFTTGANLAKLVYATYYTSENGGSWVCRGDGGTTSIGITNIDYNDSLCFRIDLEDAGEVGFIVDACVCLENPPAVYTSGSGTIVRCSPYYNTVALGMT